MVWRRKHYHPSTLLIITSYVMQVMLPPRAARVSQGQNRVGRSGRIAFFPKHRRARLSLPPNPPISLPHFILPYKLTHSSSHPLRGEPNGPSERLEKCRAFVGTPRVGDFYLPILHPGDMCSSEKINKPWKSVATHVTTDPRKSDELHRIRDTKWATSRDRRSSDFVRAESGRVTYL